MVDLFVAAFAFVVEKLQDPWVLVGLAGQFLFMMRFLVQWVHSERHKRSLVPVVFWFFSMGGGLVLLAYGLAKEDLVIITGQSLGLIIYARNLSLIYGAAKRRISADDLTEAKRLIDELSVQLHAADTLDRDTSEIEGTVSRLNEILRRHHPARPTRGAAPAPAPAR